MRKIKVAFLTKYHPNGASSRYRYYNYKEFLSSNIDAYYFPLLSEEYVENINIGKKNKKTDVLKCYIKRCVFLLKNKKHYKLLVIEKELFPYIPYFIEKLLLNNVSYALDFDDNPETKYVENKYLNFLFRNKIKKLVENARFITAGNRWYAKKYNFKKEVYYLPTVVDYTKYVLLSKYNLFSIVWIGSRSTTKYLYLVVDILNDLYTKGNKFQLITIGPENFKIEGNKFPHINITWSEEVENTTISKCHLGIMPLPHGDWSEGKCGFKLIQYLASGIPFIASNTIANYDIACKSQCGYVVNDKEDWLDKLEYYMGLNRNEYNDISLRALKTVKDNYSYQSCGKLFSQFIEEGAD